MVDRVSKQILTTGDRLTIGDYAIEVEFNLPTALGVLQASTVVKPPTSLPTQVATELSGTENAQSQLP
jgi:predicted component of type VI protein secretion system